MTPEVSIIIPTRGRSDHLANLLSDLVRLKVTERAEVIVVDEGGTFAEQVNEGARRAKRNDLILMNDDIRLDERFVELGFWLGKSPIRYPWPIEGIKLLYPSGLVQSAGIGFDAQGNPYNLWEYAPGEHPAFENRSYPSAVSFACVRIVRWLWERIGGLDEGYTNAYEDVDFCLQTREAGYQPKLEPTIMATHLTSQSAGRHDHDQESFQHFHRKWIETGRLWRTLGVFPFTIGGGQ